MYPKLPYLPAPSSPDSFSFCVTRISIFLFGLPSNRYNFSPESFSFVRAFFYLENIVADDFSHPASLRFFFLFVVSLFT